MVEDVSENELVLVATDQTHMRPFQRYQSFNSRIVRTLYAFARGQVLLYTQREPSNQSNEVSKVQSCSSADPLNLPNTIDANVRPQLLDVVLRRKPLSHEEMVNYAWNPKDRSKHISVKSDDPLTFHRMPIAQSTDCIRGKIGYSRGFHVWKLTWPEQQRGSHPMVGVATKDFELQHTGYLSYLGSNSESYGWNINENMCYHNSKNSIGWRYPKGKPHSILPKQFYCILDMDEGYMAFATSKQYLGIAFTGLKGKTLYPIVSVVWGHSEVTMEYVGGVESQPRTLMDICRRAIRVHLGRSRLRLVNKLELPWTTANYLVYK